MRKKILLLLVLISIFTSIEGQEICKTSEDSYSWKNLSPMVNEFILNIKSETIKKEEPAPEKPSGFSSSILVPFSKNYSREEKITFWAFALGGEAPYGYRWFSSQDGFLGEGRNFSKSLSLGKHEILLETEDAHGSVSTDNLTLEIKNITEEIANDSLEIFVKILCNKNGSCDEDENLNNCPQDCSGRKDNYCDGVSDNRCDPDCQRDQDSDCLCNKDDFCEIEFENYGNCPDDCLSGSRDNYCDRVFDDKCDPDCQATEDSDCQKNYLEYGILLIFILLIFLAYLKLKKFITEK